MRADDVKTVPDELLRLAFAFCDSAKSAGYSLKIEPMDLELPNTPLFVAKRSTETLFGLVQDELEFEQIDNWERYAQSCHRDTRLCVAVKKYGKVRATTVTDLRKRGIGLKFLKNGSIETACDSRDLAFKAALPERSRLSTKLRKHLGVAYDKFENGDWKDGFEDACVVLEDECRKYLIKRAKRPTASSYKIGKKTRTLSKSDIEKATLGGVGKFFCAFVYQNQIDSKLCSAIRKLNPDRIRQAHKRKSHQSEAALRRAVGPRMWLIVNALELLL